MIRSADIGDVIFINFLLMILWHLIVLFLCKCSDISLFNPERRMYSLKKWEKNGKFYTDILKIKKWKDRLPQYVAKNGFSKRTLSYRLNKEYINRFIVETCRAEWNHLMCCMYFIISVFINSKLNALIFSIIPIAINLPFLFIQRFNRIRLYKLVNR